MTINPTYLARASRSSANWQVARTRVVRSYREWLRAVRGIRFYPWEAPEIQTMYSVPKNVAEIRTKIRQEFERHRYVKQLPVVDVLIFNSDTEFQETMNFWKQLNHVLKYWRAEEDPNAKLPTNFVSGFLEGRN